MNPVINRFVFTQINLDSSSLTVLTSAIHKFSEIGEYSGTILTGVNVIGHFNIVVSDSSESSQHTMRQYQKQSTQTCADSHMDEPQQYVHIDLQQLDMRLKSYQKDSAHSYFVKPGGYAVFYVSAGAGSYAVEIQKIGKDKPTKVFDNRDLKDQDLFTAMVLRPGTYSIMEVNTNGKGELTVLYPEIGKIPRNPESVSVECSKSTVTPNKIKIYPTQGLVFNSKLPFRVKIELIKPEDRLERPTEVTKQSNAPSTVSSPPSKKTRRRITSSF